MSQGKKSVVLLVSSMSLNREQVQNQQRAVTLLDANKIPFETIDGADPKFKNERNDLFKLSGIRATYPQFFILENDNISFLGDWESVEAMNDASSLPDDILEANPAIMTWDRLFDRQSAPVK